VKKIQILVAFFLFSIFQNVFAQVHLPKVNIDGTKIERADFPLIIRSICRSAIKYSLDKPGMADFDKAKNNFYGALNCLLREAKYYAKKRYDSETAGLINPLGFAYMTSGGSWDSSSCFAKLDNLRVLKDYSTTTGTVPVNFVDFKDNMNTLCIDGRDFNYKSCIVMEVFYKELCGYQEFLYWRMVNTSVNATDFGDKPLTLDKLGTVLDAKDKYIEDELEKSKKFVDKLVVEYTNYETSYKTHSRLVAIEYGLKMARAFSEQIRRAINTWPAKFINASSEICEQ